MNKIILACLLTGMSCMTSFADLASDYNNALSSAIQTIYSSGLASSGCENANCKKYATECGMMFASEYYYNYARILSSFVGFVNQDLKSQNKMETDFKGLFNSFENENAKKVWYDIASSLSRILSNNADPDYKVYSVVSGVGNIAAFAEKHCLEAFSKFPIMELNTNLDINGKFGNVRLADSISKYANYGGIDNYGGIVEDTNKVVLKNDLEWYLLKARYDVETYLGYNRFAVKSDAKYLGEERFSGAQEYRVQDMQIGNLTFHAPIAYISPSSKKVYAIEMNGSTEDSTQIVEILSNTYGKPKVPIIWFSSSRILYLKRNDSNEMQLLMIDVPLYLEHINWVEKKRSELIENEKKKEKAQKKEAENFFK